MFACVVVNCFIGIFERSSKSRLLDFFRDHIYEFESNLIFIPGGMQ